MIHDNCVLYGIDVHTDETTVMSSERASEVRECDAPSIELIWGSDTLCLDLQKFPMMCSDTC